MLEMPLNKASTHNWPSPNGGHPRQACSVEVGRISVKSNRIIRHILLYILLALFLAVFVGPFLWMIGASLQLGKTTDAGSCFLWPDPVSFASYKEIIYGALFDEAVISTEGYSFSYSSSCLPWFLCKQWHHRLECLLLLRGFWSLCCLPHRAPELPRSLHPAFFHSGCPTCTSLIPSYSHCALCQANGDE